MSLDPSKYIVPNGPPVLDKQPTKSSLYGEDDIADNADHVSNTGRDDHLQYSPVNGDRDYTGTVGGIGPVADSDFTTKKYVDESGATKIKVLQVAHGLAIQDAVYFDGSVWAKAKSNALDTIGVGIIEAVTDVDNFILVTGGRIQGLSGLSVGEWYYVSDSTAGLLTLTESAIYSNPLMVAISSTVGVIVPLRAQDIGGSSRSVTRSDYDSVNLNYLYTGTADPATPTSSALWRISRFDFATGLVTYADGNQLYDNSYDDRESLSYL